MKKDFMLFLIFGLICGLSVAGCGEDNDTDPADSGDNGTDSSSGFSDGDDSDTSSSQAASCNLDILETFDSAVPTGWTILASSSNSGSGSASGASEQGESEETWHHTTTEAETDISYGMDGGYMFVGGYAGMDESLITDYYELGACTDVTMSFTHYFDDFRGDDDRGELWFVGDAPPWTKIGTYSSNENDEAVTETVDLSSYVLGQSGFQLKFVFADDGQGNYGWAVDDVKIVGSK